MMQFTKYSERSVVRVFFVVVVVLVVVLVLVLFTGRCRRTDPGTSRRWLLVGR